MVYICISNKKMIFSRHPILPVFPGFSRLIILLISAIIFSRCSNPNAAQKDTFGEVDTARIASDTAMQANMDLSYEYLKTLIQSDSVVYDFLAYDRPSYADPKKWEGKFIVIRRTNTKQDTIIKDKRFGPVKGLSLAYLDHKASPDILFYEDKTADKYRWVVRIYSPMPDGKYKEIRWNEFNTHRSNEHYRAGDTFFVYQNYLVRRYPYYEHSDDSIAKQNIWQSYTVKTGQLILENEKKEDINRSYK
jgi:hypothetical protein